VETVSVPECSRRSGFRVHELGNGAIARADSSYRTVGFSFDPLACKLKRWIQIYRQMNNESMLTFIIM